MESRCDVCGCVTEQTDLKSYKLDDKEFMVCVFCRKQLERLPNGAQDVENLLHMDTKGKRSDECQQALEKFIKGKGIDITDKASVQKITAAMPVYGAQNTPEQFESLPLEQQVQMLHKQVDELNNKIERFKKRYLLSKVLGYILPVVFVVIMLIILLSTGLLQNIFDYYGTLGDYANM